MSEPPPKSPSFEIPDLDVAPPVSKRPASAVPSRAASSPVVSLSDPLLDDADDFELVPTGAALEVGGGIQHDVAPRADDSKPWPTGRSRSVDQLPIDPAEVSFIAGYGPAPSFALSSPLYAFRVYQRRAPLKSAIATHHQALNQAEAERDDALMQLTNELRPVLTQNEAFRRLLQPITEVERLASERTVALIEADAGMRAEMAKFDTELATLGEQETAAAAVIAERSKTSDAARNELRRAEAKQQRLQIEIRGVMDVARQAVGPAGGDIPAAQAEKLAELQSRVTALEPELTRAKSDDAAAGAALDSAEAEQRRVSSRIKQLARQKTMAGGALEKQVTVRAAGVTDAEKQRRDALAEVARSVLFARGGVQVGEPTLEALRAHDHKVETAAIRLEQHVRALHSYDLPRVRQGVILVLSGLGLVVLAVLLKAML